MLLVRFNHSRIPIAAKSKKANIAVEAHRIDSGGFSPFRIEVIELMNKSMILIFSILN